MKTVVCPDDAIAEAKLPSSSVLATSECRLTCEFGPNRTPALLSTSTVPSAVIEPRILLGATALTTRLTTVQLGWAVPVESFWLKTSAVLLPMSKLSQLSSARCWVWSMRTVTLPSLPVLWTGALAPSQVFLPVVSMIAAVEAGAALPTVLAGSPVVT